MYVQTYVLPCPKVFNYHMIPHKWRPYGAHAGKEGSKRNVIIALPATAWDNETSFVKTEQKIRLGK